jgi:uncharacterized protein DUF6962
MVSFQSASVSWKAHEVAGLMAEPTTALTDWALAALAVALGLLLLRRTSPGAVVPVSRRLWAWSFLALAGAALLGGTSHALGPDRWPAVRATLWPVTYAAVGLANLFLLAGASAAVLPLGARRPAFVLFGVRFLAFVVLVLPYGQLRLVVIDNALSLLLLLLSALERIGRGDRAGRPLLAGILVTIAGGLVQSQRLAPHPLFNHNDLLHVLLMAGLLLIYRAGRALRDFHEPGDGAPAGT